MNSPCMMCHIHGGEYSEEGCKDCDYAIAVKKLKECEEIIENRLGIKKCGDEWYTLDDLDKSNPFFQPCDE